MVVVSVVGGSMEVEVVLKMVRDVFEVMVQRRGDESVGTTTAELGRQRRK